jgi:glycosyltransferase involved in cell wall biosynthesis
MATISVVIPVYRAEDCLEELYRRLKAALESVSESFEIVLVEDRGGDRSWEIIQALSQRDPRVKGLQFSRNFGQHYAITAGMDHCDGDWVVVMDCDLQDRPEEIPRLYAKAQEGFDVVLARRGRRKDAATKLVASALFYRLFSYLSEIEYDGQVGNFRIMSRRVVEQYRAMRERLRFFGALVHQLGFPTSSIEVQHDPRFAGETTYNFRKLMKLASEAVIAYSDKPLRLAVKLGFAVSFFAFVAGIVVGVRALFYGSIISGWASLIISIYFMGGIITALLGVIGIYLGKTFDETKKRPLYIVMSSTFDERRRPD